MHISLARCITQPGLLSLQFSCLLKRVVTAYPLTQGDKTSFHRKISDPTAAWHSVQMEAEEHVTSVHANKGLQLHKQSWLDVVPQLLTAFVQPLLC